jgi:hypothetical protein
MEKENSDLRQPVTREQIIGVIVGVIVVGMFMAIITGCSKTQKSDKELFIEFYESVLDNAAKVDALYAPFGLASKSGDILKMVTAAVDAQEKMLKATDDLVSIKVPDLRNDKVQEELKTAMKYIESAYSKKYNIIKSVVEYSKNPSLYSVAKAQSNAENLQSHMAMGIIAFTYAGMELGLTEQEMKERRLINKITQQGKPPTLPGDSQGLTFASRNNKNDC